LDVIFLTNVFNGSEYFPALLETVGLDVPNPNLETLACLISTLNVETVLPLDFGGKCHRR
jgi:hypothetical protein